MCIFLDQATRLFALQEHVLRWIKPLTTSFVLGTFADLTRGKAELLAENALLRHQLIIFRRQVKQYMKQIRAFSCPWTELENLPAQSCGRGVDL